MIRKVTKQSTITPITKSTGSGVANMGKKSKGLSMAQNKKKSPSRLSSLEAAKEMSGTKSKMPRIGMSTKDKKNMAMQMAIGAAAGASMPSIASRITKIGTKSPGITKAKAKMLPEVTVTAPKPKKRLALKVTSKRMR